MEPETRTTTTTATPESPDKIVHVVTLDNIANGAIAAEFAAEFARVIENIVDVRADATTKREITIKVAFIPTDERDFLMISGNVTSKLAKLTNTARTKMTLSHSRRGVIVREATYQPEMFDS